MRNIRQFSGSGKILGICACLNLEVLSVPEGLVHSIGILEAPGVFLAHPWLKCSRRLALKSWMLYSDSLREMMQNGLNESFWDGLGVKIGPCANFDPKTLF